ncbi:MAG: dihydroneopterin aldolase [Verrucomicrobiota bacterium]
MDTIEIRRLRLETHIGVPDEERATRQVLLATLRMVPMHGFDGLDDDIARTVDYHQVALEVQALAGNHPRKLIETLAAEIAAFLLDKHPLKQVFVTLEKHILPDTECVAVHLERSR